MIAKLNKFGKALVEKKRNNQLDLKFTILVGDDKTHTEDKKYLHKKKFCI